MEENPPTPNAAPPTINQYSAGNKLREHMERANKANKALAGDLYVDESNTRYWKLGRHAIPVDKMKPLQKVLHLNDTELAELNRLAAPFRGLSDRMNALDSEWLNEQPSEKQAGLLLRAYHVDRYMSSQQLAYKLGISSSSVRQWEVGTKPIFKNQMTALQPHLGLSDAETAKLTELSDICRQHLAEKRAMKVHSSKVGAALPTAECDLLRETLVPGR